VLNLVRSQAGAQPVVVAKQQPVPAGKHPLELFYAVVMHLAALAGCMNTFFTGSP
jgi:hypothetical protein